MSGLTSAATNEQSRRFEPVKAAVGGHWQRYFILQIREIEDRRVRYIRPACRA